MLQSHLNNIENILLQKSKIPATSGHSLHKGTPRETFVKEFLEDHLSELIGIGTGEIIDADSEPNTQRNQNDIVLYRKNFPTIDFGAKIKAFLAESVIATIEVKSTLTEEELKNSFNSIINTKKLKRQINSTMSNGYVPPGILSIIIAYDGPANMSTVKGWIDKYVIEKSITYPEITSNTSQRLKVKSPVADLIIVLGKGYIQFDNGPITFLTSEIREEYTKAMATNEFSHLGQINWAVADQKNDNLIMLFLLMTLAISGTISQSFSIMPYVKTLRPPENISYSS